MLDKPVEEQHCRQVQALFGHRLWQVLDDPEQCPSQPINLSALERGGAQVLHRERIHRHELGIQAETR